MCLKGARPVPNRNASNGRRVRSNRPETLRGTFKVFASSLGPGCFVAVEECWMSNMRELAAGMQEYGDYVKAYVDTMEPDCLYGCRDPATGEWRRGRKITDYADGFLVDFVDLGRRQVIPRDRILQLSSLYKDWGIRPVDISFDGLVPATIAAFRELEQWLLNRSFEFTYVVERTGPLMRDRIRVLDIVVAGDSLLADFVAEGLLSRPRGDRTPTGSSTQRRAERAPPATAPAKAPQPGL